MFLPAHDLRKQGVRVRTMLRPISHVSSGPAWAFQTIAGNWILGTHDGSPPQGEYRAWRFATPAARHHAMYFEVWRPVSRNRYAIQRAYLTIYERNTAGAEKEILSLHCDPGEAVTAPHAQYKRGPHLHLSFIGDPLKRSHLALHVGRVDEVLATSQRLHATLADAVQMIRDEVIAIL